MIHTIQREISIRETVLHHFDATDNDWLSRHGIGPIAIVVNSVPPLQYGILLPDAGITLDRVSDDQITLEHLISHFKTVICLNAADIVHGYICEKNVCVKDSSIQLIGFDRILRRLENDVVATGQLFLRCVDRMTTSDHQMDEICESAWELIEGDDLNLALLILSDISS